jgi:hypothetical protein
MIGPRLARLIITPSLVPRYKKTGSSTKSDIESAIKSGNLKLIYALTSESDVSNSETSALGKNIDTTVWEN